MKNHLLALITIITATAIFQLSNSVLTCLIPIRLGLAEIGGFATSLVATAFSVGFLLVCPSGCFPNCKQTLRMAPTDGRSWPVPAVRQSRCPTVTHGLPRKKLSSTGGLLPGVRQTSPATLMVERGPGEESREFKTQTPTSNRI